MSKAFVYERPDAENVTQYRGVMEIPEGVGEKDMTDIEFEGLEFRVKHYANGDQMWIYMGYLGDALDLEGGPTNG